MPRVTYVKAARKDNRVCKKGEPYFWWKFRFGGKHFSLTRPRPSQLTQSSFYGAVYSLVEMIEDYEIVPGEEGAVTTLVDEVRDELETIQSDCQESLDNIPESLQYAPTGELLQERVGCCESAIDELDSIEDPEQWEEERDRVAAWDNWQNEQPAGEGEKDHNADEYAEWEGDEPEEPEGFEEFETDELTDVIHTCMDGG